MPTIALPPPASQIPSEIALRRYRALCAEYDDVGRKLGVHFISAYQGEVDFEIKGRRHRLRVGPGVPFKPSWLKPGENYWNYPNERALELSRTPLGSLTGFEGNQLDQNALEITALFHRYQKERKRLWDAAIPHGKKAGRLLPDTAPEPLQLAVPYVWEHNGEEIPWEQEQHAERKPYRAIHWITLTG